MKFFYRYYYNHIQFQEYSLEELVQIGVYKIYHVEYKPEEVVYIGSTSVKRGNTIRQGFRLRWLTHLKDLKQKSHCNSYLSNIVNKYGIEGLRFEIVEVCEPDECIEKEQYWIDYYDSYNKGYNAAPKASSTLGFKMYENVVIKRCIPIIQYSLNGDFVKEWKSRADIKRKLGFLFNPQFTQKGYQAYGFQWRKKTENYPLKIEPYKNKLCFKILCYNKEGEFLKEYQSILDASLQLEIPTGNISRALKSKTGLSYKYIWRYYSENFPKKIGKWELKTGHQKKVHVLNLETQEENVFKSFREVEKIVGIARSHFSGKSGGIVKKKKTGEKFKITILNQ